MKIENQVCTLEQAKKLKELGVGIMKHSTVFVYIPNIRNDDSVDHNNATIYTDENAYSHVRGWLYKEYRYAAFNAAELGVMLPEGFTSYYSKHLGCWLWQAVEPTDENDFGVKVTHADNDEYDTEAEARAAALIYVIENNLNTVFGVNTNLVTE